MRDEHHHDTVAIEKRAKLKSFAILTLAVIVLAAGYSTLLAPPEPKTTWGSVVIVKGPLLVRGQVPTPAPAYPMWGYPLLAGLFGSRLPVYQSVLLFAVLLFWYKSALDLTWEQLREDRFRKHLANAWLIVVLLLPWILLSTSYFTSSMYAILIFLATWVLCLAVIRKEGWIPYAATGFLLALASNVRSEALLLAMLLFLSLLAYGLIKQHFRRSLLFSLVFLSTFFIAMVPWFVYTSRTIGRASLTSTNGGGVMYLGLGTLRNNPWGIVPLDEFAHQLAKEEGLDYGWSAAADIYFKKAYVEAITQHPGSFAKRILVGWRMMLMQGVFGPNLRTVLMKSEADAALLDYLNETLKQKLGLQVNWPELEEYRSAGINIRSLSIRHFTVVFGEYALRIFNLCGLLLLVMLSGYSLASRQNHVWIALVWLSYVGLILFTAGCIQTRPRHTTVLLPILLTTTLFFVPPWTSKVRSSSRTNPPVS